MDAPAARGPTLFHTNVPPVFESGAGVEEENVRPVGIVSVTLTGSSVVSPVFSTTISYVIVLPETYGPCDVMVFVMWIAGELIPAHA